MAMILISRGYKKQNKPVFDCLPCCVCRSARDEPFREEQCYSYVLPDARLRSVPVPSSAPGRPGTIAPHTHTLVLPRKSCFAFPVSCSAALFFPAHERDLRAEAHRVTRVGARPVVVVSDHTSSPANAHLLSSLLPTHSP